MEIAGSLIATDTQFTNLIVRATQVYLDNVTADTVFMLTNTLKTPRVFIKGDNSHVKAVYFLRAKDIPHVKKFIDGELTEEEFFNSGITRTKGQVIKESGAIEVIQSISTPKYFGLTNGITIQINSESKSLIPEINLVRPNGDIVKLPD